MLCTTKLKVRLKKELQLHENMKHCLPKSKKQTSSWKKRLIKGKFHKKKNIKFKYLQMQEQEKDNTSPCYYRIGYHGLIGIFVTQSYLAFNCSELNIIKSKANMSFGKDLLIIALFWHHLKVLRHYFFARRCWQFMVDISCWHTQATRLVLH